MKLSLLYITKSTKVDGHTLTGTRYPNSCRSAKLLCSELFFGWSKEILAVINKFLEYECQSNFSRRMSPRSTKKRTWIWTTASPTAPGPSQSTPSPSWGETVLQRKRAYIRWKPTSNFEIKKKLKLFWNFWNPNYGN